MSIYITNTSGRPAAVPVQIARAIIQGDISLAREIAQGPQGQGGFIPAHCRAISGACREANRRWGTALSLTEFFKVRQ